MEKITQKLLLSKYKEALEGMYMESGIWTLPAIDCSVAVGKVKDNHGRIVEVQIKVTSEEDEWLDNDDEIEED